MSIEELAQALRAGEGAPDNVLGEDWELARRVLSEGAADAAAAGAEGCSFTGTVAGATATMCFSVEADSGACLAVWRSKEI